MSDFSQRTDADAGAPVGLTDVIRVLLVEDDRYYRETVVDELAEHGFAILGFGDGDSLLDSLEVGANADVIVLDWGLPKTSGIELLRQLRQCGVGTPVVFLTGQPLIDRKTMAFETGAVDFIDKARGGEMLVRRLEHAAGRRDLQPIGKSESS